MANRSSAQGIGSRGQHVFAGIFGNSKAWILRRQSEEDFGIDFEAELAEPNVNGQLLKIQVKSSLKLSLVKGSIAYRVDRQLLEYADACRIPVILVVVDLGKQTAWYLWLQEWIFAQNAAGKRIATLPKTVSVRIPQENRLTDGLNEAFKSIATWKTKIQIARSLGDAFRSAVSLESEETCKGILAVLKGLTGQYDDFPVESVVSEVLQTGERIWATEEGNRLSRILFTLCREYGNRFEAEHIRRLVIRGESYSRTGINALGLLYDNFPKHLKALNLPKLFRHETAQVGYYCKLRERYLGKQSTELLGPRTDFAIDGLDVDKTMRDELLLKWANRGDSAILDYLVFREHASSKEAT